jgi:hypothetical protein
MTDSYVEPRLRDLHEAKMRRFMWAYVEMGRCPVSSESRVFDPQPCLSAPTLLVEPSVWDLSQYEAAMRRTSIACRLVRCWNDLDRTEALAAHLAALDEKLR